MEAGVTQARGAKGRARFGPPKSAIGAFFWAALQLPRALLWQLRERELRSLAVLPVVVTLVVGLALTVSALVFAGPLLGHFMHRDAGVLGGVTWIAARILTTLLLVLAAGMVTWQLQGAIAGAFYERMSLYVQRVVDGEAPAPATGALQVVREAALGLFPRTKRILAWALTAIAASTLILVPGFGAPLVLVAQTAIAACFLSTGAISESRPRLGLPRLLIVREAAVVLGLALGLVPIVLFPPLMAFVGGPVTIAGALVAVGARRRREALAPVAPIAQPQP